MLNSADYWRSSEPVENNKEKEGAPRRVPRVLLSILHMYIYTSIIYNENHDIAIAMSSSRANPVLELNILHG